MLLASWSSCPWGLGGSARAEADAATAVLGLEALDGAPDNVASEITDALRQRVASTHGFQLVQGKDLVEVKLVFSCPDEGPACMAQAAKSMGATKLIFGNVKRGAADYQVTLKLLDVNRAVVDAWVTEAVPRRKAEPTVFRSLAPAWLSKLTGKGAGGSLQVRANVPGAAVSLDGTRVGVTGPQAVAIADVAPGRHEVAVEKTGYTTAKQEFSLAAGQSLPLSLQLSSMSVDVGTAPPQETPPVIVKKPLDAPEPGPSEGTSSTMSRAGFWVAVVGTAGALAGGLYFAKQVHDVNGDLDPYRHYPCANDPNSQCFANGAPYTQQAGSTKTIQNLEDRGHNDQILEEVLLISAVPLAIAGGYFLYKGYLDSGSGKESASSSASSSTFSRGLRIFPTASASSGGIVTEFDF